MSGMRIVNIATAAVLASMIASGACQAQNYPARTIRVIVPYSAGGVLDTMTRAIVERLRPILGQPVIVENKPGASTAIGLQACAISPPDGYTFCGINFESFAIVPHFEPALFERYKSLQPVTQYVSTGGVIYAHPSVPAKDLREFIALARAKPTEFNYSSFGVGTSPQLLFEWLKKKEGIEILHVPFRGAADALNEVISGRVQASYVATGFAIQHINAGTVKALAVLGEERSPLLPNVPSLGELGYPFPYKAAWFGLAAPAGTPDSITETMAAAVRKAVHDPDFKAKFLQPQDYIPVGSSPKEFAAVVRNDNANGREIMRLIGLLKE